jgi:hypothetical protein
MIGTAAQSQPLQLEKVNRKVRNLMPDADPVRQAKVRRLNAMTKVYPEKKPKTENVDLGAKGSFSVKKGALHNMLGIPQDKTIPKAREEAAARSSNPTLKRRAISALGFRAMK